MDIKKTGDFIAQRRKLMKMTQKELAEKLNVTDKAVSKWERGQGYPEITTIPHLAEVLGVSTSEIMLGEVASKVTHDDNKEIKSDEIVSSTFDYMEHLNGQNKVRVKNIAFISSTVLLLVGMFVSGLCNYIISQKSDWSLYVFGSCALTWLVTTPLLKFKKHGVIFSVAGLTVGVIPFLYLIEYLCPAKDWATDFALPIVLITFASIWLFLLLVFLAKLKPIYLICSALVIFAVIDNLIIQSFVSSYLSLPPQNSLPSVIVAICSGFAAAVFIIYAICAKKKK